MKCRETDRLGRREGRVGLRTGWVDRREEEEDFQILEEREGEGRGEDGW